MKEPDRPNRCQWVTYKGQCEKDQMDGSRFCRDHTYNADKHELRAYHITTSVLGDSPQRHAAAEEIKSLRDEIALARALAETRLNMCQSDVELITAMPSIQSYLQTVEKLVSSFHAMEVKIGNVLDKTALLTLAQRIINIIDTNLKGIPERESIVEKIGTEIVSAIQEQENEKVSTRK